MDNGLKFRTAKLLEFPRLVSMWRDCFGGSLKEAEHVFANLQKPESIFVLADESKLAAMLSVREFSLASPSGCYKAAYVYGVSTSPEWRGKGCATILLNETGALLADRKYVCSALAPASESLFVFYGKRGYENAFNINKASFTHREIKPGKTFPFEKTEADELAFIRDLRFGNSRMFARWDGGYLDYVTRESGFYGGGVYAATVDGERICAVCHKHGGAVYVKELVAAPHALEASLRSIHAHFKADEYKLYLREDVKISYTNNLLPFTMIKWYDNDIKAKISACAGAPAYIAHVMD